MYVKGNQQNTHQWDTGHMNELVVKNWLLGEGFSWQAIETYILKDIHAHCRGFGPTPNE
jgi:hypothetical protein